MREERKSRVFENRVLRRIFGPKRHKVIGEWRKLHNEDLSTTTHQQMPQYYLLFKIGFS
jgi:hypothetical protein